jgi:ribosome-binding protein aMBF1 (putative translation factor)
MFRIKSDDQRAKTVKRIERFEKDLESVRRQKGESAAAGYERTYRAHVDEFREQIERYDALRKRGVARTHEGGLGSIGGYLVDARIASGLTQAELAKKLGVSQPMVFKYEQAEYAGCATDVIDAVADALRLDLTVSIRRG